MKTHPLTVRLGPKNLAVLTSAAERSGISLSAAVNLLVANSTDKDTDNDRNN